RSSAIHGRDDRRACGRRIYNQFGDQPLVVRLSLWADAGLSIGLHDVRRDARCRRLAWPLIVCAVCAGEFIRSRTFMIKTDRLSPRVTPRFDADCPVLEVFPAPGREHAERQQRSSCRDPPTAIRWSRKSGCPKHRALEYWRLVVRVARSI